MPIDLVEYFCTQVPQTLRSHGICIRACVAAKNNGVAGDGKVGIVKRSHMGVRSNTRATTSGNLPVALGPMQRTQ